MRLFERARHVGVLTGLLLLCACQPSMPTPSADDLRRAETQTPSEPQLAQKYARSCQACHAVPGSAAPLTGFASAWAARSGQGMALLVQHAREGYKAMPPRGFCNDCSDDDIARLITFMAAPSKGAGK